MSTDRPWPDNIERIIGQAGSGDGPLLMCLAALHGNEPAGVHAARAVLAELDGVPLRGRIVVLAGNLAALRARERFCEHDLNRGWTAERIAAIRAGQRSSPEDAEFAELLATIEGQLADHHDRWYLLDMHTTSSDTAPFAVIGDSLDNRAFAAAFPVPRILGLEECIGGTVTDYLNSCGAITIGFESGQHDAPEAVDCAAAAMWVALASGGLIDRDHPRVRAAQARLRDAAGDLPRAMEVRHYHPVEPDDAFTMVEGYENFRPVESGELLATDRGGEIRAPRRARVLMPLYQDLGGDGFFLVTPIAGFWLRLSAALRHVGLPRIVHWLPGVRRHPERRGYVIVDRRIAKVAVLQLFHLLGYRYRRGDDHTMIFSRRIREGREPAL